jgi:hypothetical protein
MVFIPKGIRWNSTGYVKDVRNKPYFFADMLRMKITIIKED